MTTLDMQGGVYREGAVGVTTLEMLEDARRYNAWVCSHLMPHLGQLNLELGAGRGTLTEIIAREFDVIPVDLSPNNVAALRKRFCGHRRVGEPLADFFDYQTRQSLDAIYSSNVLEHVEDDVEVVRHAAKLLKPGGRFVAWVPAGMWLYSDFDRRIGHHRRYTRRDRYRLSSAIQREGLPLDLTHFRFYNPVGALGWFVNMRCRRRQHIRARDAKTMDQLIGWLRPLDALHLPFGQSLLMVLRRRLP